MGKVAKTVVRHGLLAKLESAYDEGHGTTSPAPGSDGIEPEGPIEVPTEFAFGGNRDVQAGAGAGPLQRGKAVGRFGSVDIPVLLRGSGSAYAAASDVEVDPLLQACGLIPTVDATGGSEKVTYDPSTDLADLASIAASFYGRGQLYPAQAGLGNLTFELNDNGFLLATFGLNLRFPDAFTDVSRPSITLASQIHPTATNLGLTLGNYSAIVRSLSFDMGRDVGGRVDYGGGGHAGFAPGVMEPTLSVTIEAASLASSSPWHTPSDFDPYRFHEDATQFAIGFTVGGTQYNQVEFSAPQAQLSEPPVESEDGPTATWDLTFMLAASAPAADDFFSLIYK